MYGECWFISWECQCKVLTGFEIIAACRPLADELKSGLTIFEEKNILKSAHWLTVLAPAKHYKSSNLPPISPVGGASKS